MASFHQTIIVGNLGRDVETRYLPNGDPVANFPVAVTESWKDRNSGEKKEATTWYRVSAFGKLAEICDLYLKKGSSVMIVGKMNQREWEKEGVKQYSWELRADTMQMLGSRGGQRSGDGDGGQGGGDYRGAKEGSPAPKKKAPSFDDMDDDIPF